jgi:hypothetical protein
LRKEIVVSKEQGAEGREQGAGSREQRAEGREQRKESRERKKESREQRAEQRYAYLDLERGCELLDLRLRHRLVVDLPLLHCYKFSKRQVKFDSQAAYNHNYYCCCSV